MSLLLVTAVALSLCSCNSQKPDRVQVYPVTGVVLVDGQPVTDLRIVAHNVAGMDKEHPTIPHAVPEADGHFQFTSYENGDGVPAGEYKLTFMWGQRSRGRIQGPDKLKDRYTDAATSKFPLKVDNEAVDLGTIELTTK
jgi:5-hydroxyisourate hydrolase-like protein (transthyretin family)